MWPPFLKGFVYTVMIEIERCMADIEALLSEGSAFLLEHLGGGTVAQQKGDRDYALTVDVELERLYRQRLLALYPEIPILGEELSPDEAGADRGLFWAIDPIDGTVNYASGLPEYGTSIALLQNGKPIAAGIAFPSLGETYLAGKGRGAFRNGTAIHVSDQADFRQAMVGYGDFAVLGNYEEKNVVRMACLQSFVNQVLRVRIPGSAALQLAWVAAGRLDVSITLSNNAWDVQGGVLLIREAGGQVYDCDGTDHSVLSKYTIASNSCLKETVLHRVSFR